MPQLSRRQVVVLGGVGIAAITTGVAGLVGQQRAGTGASRTKWKEPPRMASVDGRLDVELTAGQHQAQLAGRSEEHTSELQSRGHLVCRLLLEKKKDKIK